MQRLNIDDTRALSLIPCNVKDAQCLYQTLTLLISSAFVFFNPFNLSLLTNICHFSFPGRLDCLDLKCCELVIFAKPPVRGNSLDDRPTVTPVRWRSKKEWTKDSSVVTPCRATCPQFGPVGREETRFLPVWPPGIEGRNRSFGFGLTGKDQSSWLPHVEEGACLQQPENFPKRNSGK